MSSNIAVKVENTSKLYQLYNQPQDRLKQSILPRLQHLAGIPPRQYFREFWALRDISFEIEKGETIGIVGRNGSGKSTLLQIICGTLTPTTGDVFVDGRLTALLELGSGFNPEFSGRENVYLSGSIMGFSKEEMDNWFDDIAAFADIGVFIDQQVKFYSSGMYVRLAFATNIMVQPDIMVVDEALAVGDMKFQVKCMSALRRRQESGATILFVSHAIDTVKSLCTRAIYLEGGELRQIGSAVDVANAYFKDMRKEIDAELRQGRRIHVDEPNVELGQQQNSSQELPVLHGEQAPSETDIQNFEKSAALFRMGMGGARILYADLLDENKISLSNVEFNQPVWVRIWLEALEEKELTANFYILDDKSIPITGSNLILSNHSLLHAKPGDKFLVEYHIPALPLQHGIYSLNVSLIEPTTATIDTPSIFVDYIENAVVFNMAARKQHKIWAKVFLFPSVDVKKL
jgi:lipopolysaccharide transport system ATP-binding protein